VKAFNNRKSITFIVFNLPEDRVYTNFILKVISLPIPHL